MAKRVSIHQGLFNEHQMTPEIQGLLCEEHVSLATGRSRTRGCALVDFYPRSQKERGLADCELAVGRPLELVHVTSAHMPLTAAQSGHGAACWTCVAGGFIALRLCGFRHSLTEQPLTAAVGSPPRQRTAWVAGERAVSCLRAGFGV